MKHRPINLIAALAVGAAAASGGWAAPAPAEREQPQAGQRAFAAAATVSDATLDRATAREDVAMVAETEQAASVSESSVTGRSVTGELSIAGQAFENASGMTIVNANTGNNVAINASVNVNIVITPPSP